MFHRIELTDPFGVHKNFTYDFQKGLTAISGPNGAGKTLITEMLDFALWGTEALRGPASDYSKGLSVRVWVEIRGKVYKIFRTGSQAELTDIGTGDTIAQGVKFVNQKVKDLMGYSYDVYRVTNVARQGEIERMGNMKPTERKALVDETIGLAKIEALAEWIAKQQALASGKLNVLSEVLVVPGPAPEPVASADKAEVSELQTKRGIWSVHRGYLVAPEPIEPHPRVGEFEALTAQQEARVQALARIEGLQAALRGFRDLGPKPELHPQDAELDALETETARFRELTSNIAVIQKALGSYSKESTVPEEALALAEQAIAQHSRWVRKQELSKNLVQHQCPQCSHIWHDDDPRLKDFEDVKEDASPSLTAAQIAEERRINSYQETRKSLVDGLAAAQKELAGLKDNLFVTGLIKGARAQVATYEEQLKHEEQRQALLKQAEETVVPEDVSAIREEILRYNADLQAYTNRLVRHQEALLATRGIPEDIEQKTSEAEENYAAYQQYLYATQTHQRAVDTYNTSLEQINAQKLVVQDWRNARDSVVLLRSRIKSYLLPSLNDVATKILFNMSNQWLNWVVVNEDFDITVDSKSIKVLSGAGKALTNLALRIGLGQVLTNSVFPVLILDEADAGVDKDKAPMVAQALRRLTGTIAQIIVISHKAGIEADHNLELV